MEIVLQIINFLPLVGLLYVVYRAARTEDDIEALKFLLWGVLFQSVPIIDYVLNN
jgi:hypothetical protein